MPRNQKVSTFAVDFLLTKYLYMLNQYETVFIATPVLSESQMKEAVAKFKKIITDSKGDNLRVVLLYKFNDHCLLLWTHSAADHCVHSSENLQKPPLDDEVGVSQYELEGGCLYY